MYYISRPQTSLFKAFDLADYTDPSSFNLHDASVYPKFCIKEQKDNFKIEVIVPGYRQSDLDIEVTQHRLTIKSNNDQQTSDTSCGEEEEASCNTYCRDFSKHFELSDAIDTEAIKASLQDGILTILLGKTQQAQAKKIAID